MGDGSSHLHDLLKLFHLLNANCGLNVRESIVVPDLNVLFKNGLITGKSFPVGNGHPVLSKQLHPGGHFFIIGGDHAAIASGNDFSRMK